MKLFLAIFLLVISTSVFAISADELRTLSGKADQERRAKSRRLNVNDLNSFLSTGEDSKNSKPVENIEQSSSSTPDPVNVKKTPSVPVVESNETTDETPKPSNPVSNKHPAPDGVKRFLPSSGENDSTPKKQNSPSKGSQAGVSTEQPKPKPKPRVNYSVGEYIPPPRKTSSASNNTSDVVSVGQRKFGITLGTWFKADLRRRTTNSDPGLIEMVIMQDVEGSQNDLPAGTYLFCEKSYNQGTKRLDLHVIKALLPDGDEIELSGLVYDSVKVAGLQGIIVENGSSAVESGFKTGLISAGQTLINQASKGAVGTEIITSTTNSVADNKLSTVKAGKAIPYTVHVSPQPVFIQIQETF